MGLQPLLDRGLWKCWPTVIEKFLGVDEVPAERSPLNGIPSVPAFLFNIRRTFGRPHRSECRQIGKVELRVCTKDLERRETRPLGFALAGLSNLQLSVGTSLATDPQDIGNRPKSRDLQVSTPYNFNIHLAMARPIWSGESSWTKWTLGQR